MEQLRNIFLAFCCLIFSVGCGNNDNPDEQPSPIPTVVQQQVSDEELVEILVSAQDGDKGPYNYKGTIQVSTVGSRGSEPLRSLEGLFLLSSSVGALDRTTIPVKNGIGSVKIEIDFGTTEWTEPNPVTLTVKRGTDNLGGAAKTKVDKAIRIFKNRPSSGWGFTVNVVD